MLSYSPKKAYHARMYERINFLVYSHSALVKMTIQHHNNSQRGGQLVEKPLAFQARSSSHILYYFPLYHHHQNRSCWILSSPEFQLRRSKRFRAHAGEKSFGKFCRTGMLPFEQIPQQE